VICERCGARFRGQCDNANRFCSPSCWYETKRRSPEVIEAVRALWVKGMKTTNIAKIVKLKNKNVVIGLAHRAGFPRHPSKTP
jgi:hypothetical protein